MPLSVDLTSLAQRNISPTITGDKEIAGAAALRLHHLRWHVPFATCVRRRSAGADGLDECPRHRHQCQGLAEPALTFIPPPGDTLSPRALQLSLLARIKLPQNWLISHNC